MPRVRVGAQVSDADDANEPVATMINVLAALAIFAQDTVSYDKPETWLCRPGRQDACAIDLTTSVIAADGHLTTESWRADAKAPIDCFYVYPTVSLDTTDHSDMNAGEEERNAVRQQFARFGSVCRPYAPIYRQVSLRGLRVLMATPGAAPEAMVHAPGYDDVLAAWRYYLAHDNGGRGVVLIGHSQGATVLKQLIRQEIDGKPVQSRIVSAILVGNAVAVPVGRDVGGTFQSMPLCRKSNQTGCIITYASFRNTVPPSANALFGRVPGDGMMAACTNPAALGGGSGQLHAYLTGVGTLVTTTAMPRHRWTADGASIGTPFVSVPGLLTAQCVSDSLGSRLEVTVHADTTDGRADDVPGDIGVGTPAQARWGLHLIDVNLAMGNLLDIVRRQSAAFRR